MKNMILTYITELFTKVKTNFKGKSTLQKLKLIIIPLLALATNNPEILTQRLDDLLGPEITSEERVKK